MTTVETTTPLTSADQWWRRAVVYQIYPRSFADSNGDGIGDLRGIIGKLDHLVALGVDVLWLSPFYPSPQADNGYDVSDLTSVDPIFGTLSDFSELLETAHRYGMKVVLDIVPNHTSDQHLWFQESLQGSSSRRRDWYIWRSPRAGRIGGTPGAEPTNWESFFSGSTWTYDPGSGQYYLHLFSPHQPDLNWENPDVREAIADALRCWIDRGVDGFRFDVLNLISKDQTWPDGVVPPGGRFGDGHPHFTSGPRVHEYVNEMISEIRTYAGRPMLTIGETPDVSLSQGVLFTDPARGEVDMIFQFDHVGLDQGAHKFDLRPFNLLELKDVFGRWQHAMGHTGWNSLYWNNHDQPRVVSRFGDDGIYRERSATMLATVLHLHRGTPFIYQGEELGLPNTEFDGRSDFRDIESLNYYDGAIADGVPWETVMAGLRAVGRDNARTPFPWTEEPHGGFTTGTPWLPLNPTYPAINAAAQTTRPDSVFHYYRALIDLRHRDDTVVFGDFTMLLPDSPAVYAYRRTWRDDTLLVLGNFTDAEHDVDLSVPEGSGVTLVLGNCEPPRQPLDRLRPWEARVLRVNR